MLKQILMKNYKREFSQLKQIEDDFRGIVAAVKF